jgi:Polysaccharide biosynthesis/export protein/SLBB domain
MLGGCKTQSVLAWHAVFEGACLALPPRAAIFPGAVAGLLLAKAPGITLKCIVKSEAYMRYLAWIALLLVGWQLLGCTLDLGPIVVMPDEAPTERTQNRIQPGDKIKVIVYGEENLGGVFDVDPDGTVSLPLAGTVKAAGRTRRELEKEITGKYRSEYLQNPQVTVDFAAFRPFYVLGEAEHPGEYAYKAGTTVLDAITTAGGPSYRASRSLFRVKHAGEFEWKEYAQSSATRILILPGDSIWLPERYF